MLKSIVYLNADLPSSFALRYACHLANITEMEINTFHVESPETEGHPAGIGWALKTWENELIMQGREKIMPLINAEKNQCLQLKPLKIVVGNPENELLRELQKARYDLFVLGVMHSFTPQQFYNRMHSKFYRQSPCPILLVKNLIDIKRIAILLEPGENGSPQARTYANLFKKTSVEVDLVNCSFKKIDPFRSDPIRESFLSTDEIESDKTAASVHAQLQSDGIYIGGVTVLEGIPRAVAERLSAYSLVLTCLPQHISPASPLLDCLSRIPSPILFCKES